MSYAIKNLRDIEDMALRYGTSDTLEARFPAKDLRAETAGFAYLVIRPGKRQPFGHRHEAAEEVHVVLSGSGRVRLDDEIVELRPLDALRVAPQVARRFEAGPDGLELLVFGPRHRGDAEVLGDFWAD